MAAASPPALAAGLGGVEKAEELQLSKAHDTVRKLERVKNQFPSLRGVGKYKGML